MYKSPEIVKMTRERLQKYRDDHPVYDNDAFNEMLVEWDDIARTKLDTFKQDNSTVQWKRMIEQSIERRIREEYWPELMTCLERYIAFIQKVTLDFYTTFKNDADDRFKSQHAILSRACQIACAILTLLRHGYADEAHATWRTLYELSIVSRFISRYDKDGAAKHYLEQIHPDVPSNRTQTYAWAAKTLNRKRINFSELEKITNAGALTDVFEGWRYVYRDASQNVHAIPKNIRARLSKGVHLQEAYLYGPSVLGLGFPSLFTADSLGSITVDFIVPRLEDSEFMFVLNLLRVLEREIFEVQTREHQLVEHEMKIEEEILTHIQPHFFYT